MRVQFCPPLGREATAVDMPAVPRQGDTVRVEGMTYVVRQVHWWDPQEEGNPDAVASVLLETVRQLYSRYHWGKGG